MAVTGGEPISAANLSAAIASAVQSAVAQATAGAKTYTDAAVQKIRDEQAEMANTFYSCDVSLTYHTNPRRFEIYKSNEQSNGGVTVSYVDEAGSGHAARATVRATTAGSYDVSLDGRKLGRFYGGSGQSYQFVITPPTDFTYSDGHLFGAYVFVERVA